MIESTSKMSSAVGELAAGRDVGVHEDDAPLGTLTCLSAGKETIALRSDTPATLGFIRGTGKMAVRGGWVDYHDGKWFEITGLTAYQIFPDTDTVLLTIQKPGTASAEEENNISPKDAPLSAASRAGGLNELCFCSDKSS